MLALTAPSRPQAPTPKCSACPPTAPSALGAAPPLWARSEPSHSASCARPPSCPTAPPTTGPCTRGSASSKVSTRCGSAVDG
eukprot:2417432-Rhodomonas_salina.1